MTYSRVIQEISVQQISKAAAGYKSHFQTPNIRLRRVTNHRKEYPNLLWALGLDLEQFLHVLEGCLPNILSTA